MLTSLDEASAWPRADGLPRFDVASLDGVCFVPATAEAYARRGFDHMEHVASHFSAATGIPLVDVLARRSARDQRELGRAERALNLAGSVDVVDDVWGLNLLLLDDVITTGATVREAARALLGRGAGEVSACALARVW
jgi:predicted amidophosphoribosyltransferase